ncbi:hypothetical protein Tco_0184515 [Tanacetum coccineum]
MDDPNITIGEYIRLKEEKARRRGKVYNWETTTYGKIWDIEDVHDLGSVETEFPAIVFNDTLTSEATTIVYNDALTSKLDFLIEPTVSPQHIDEFNLKDETSLSGCDEKEQNVLHFNDLFPFNVIYPGDSKSDKDDDDDKIDIKQPSMGGDLVLNINVLTLHMLDCGLPPNTNAVKQIHKAREEKARRHGKVFNWETTKYGKIRVNEDVHNLRSVKTEFPAIAFNDEKSSEKTLSCEPTVSSLNNEVDFRISFDNSDNDDHTVIFDKNLFSYKIISVNNLKTNSENDNEKVNMPSLPSPEPTVSCFGDLDFFNDFENEFPAIVYNDALTSKLDLSTEPTLCPKHIDDFDLKYISSKQPELKRSFELHNWYQSLVARDIWDQQDSSRGSKQKKYVDVKKKQQVRSMLKKYNDGNSRSNDSTDSCPKAVTTASYIMLSDMSLPPRDQRHQYLRYEGLQMLMEHHDDGGAVVFTSQAWRRLFDTRGPLRQFILALGLHTAEEMELPGFARTSPSYTLIRDPVLRLCHRMMAHSIAGRSQAPEKVTMTDLFYLRRLDVGSVNIPYLLARYLRRFKMHPGKLKSRWYGPNVVKTVYPYGTVEITDKNGVSFKVNGQRLKKYHERHTDAEVVEFEDDTTRRDVEEKSNLKTSL